MPNLFLVIFEIAWMNYIQAKEASGIDWVLLEIKVPATIEKGPQVFENILAGLYSTQGIAIDTKFDIYLKGMVEEYFSLEIVGIDGQTHFYIRANKKMKDFIEAQVYAQYPAAEINEAPDYAVVGPRHFPDKHWEMWGTEMILVKEDAYPIRTYIDFQETFTNLLIDPVASFIEEYSTLLPGEQIWFQILIRPASSDYWKKDAEALIGKLIGRKEKPAPKGMFADFRDFFTDIFSHLPGAALKVPEFAKKETEKDNIKESLMLYLSPDQKQVVEAISRNITKVGYETTIRWIYIGKKEVFNKGKGVAAIFAPLRQFESQLLNGFTPNSLKKTSKYYLFTEFRKNIVKNLLISDYRKRKISDRGFVLNSEELATIYHFPTFEVKAPQTPWVKARRSEAPRELPIG